MKNLFLAIFFVLFLFPKYTFGQEKPCEYNLYYYNEESVALKFECDTIEPFVIQFFSKYGEMINEISYQPLKNERFFIITCVDCDIDLVISILYPGNSSTFLYTKK